MIISSTVPSGHCVRSSPSQSGDPEGDRTAAVARNRRPISRSTLSAARSSHLPAAMPAATPRAARSSAQQVVVVPPPSTSGSYPQLRVTEAGGTQRAIAISRATAAVLSQDTR